MCLTTLRHYTSRTGANNDGSDVDILGQGPNMSDWLHNLPVLWMALVVFGVTYLIAASIYAGVNALAVGERARAFKAVSPGILSPMGIVFGLYLAFTAAQVWGDIDRANAAVNREASALSAIVILAASFPSEPEQQTRALVRRHIENTAFQEWPMMARHSANPAITPAPLPRRYGLTCR